MPEHNAIHIDDKVAVGLPFKAAERLEAVTRRKIGGEGGANSIIPV